MGYLSSLDSTDVYTSFRLQMVATIELEVIETVGYIGKETLSHAVIESMATVPRHEFVPLGTRAYAYDDCALSIGLGQTISQPYIVAVMTDLIDPQPNHTVLEVGTGSGYQAAVLSRIVQRVYSMEVVSGLASAATQTLECLGYKNISIRNGNGCRGWKQKAPFDSILVTAAGDVSPALLEQLKVDGKIIVPVGRPNETQYLTLLEKKDDNCIHRKIIMPVRFVPLITGNLEY